ncbi:MAG: restriction endonuclease subunit S [Bacteroidota bacterium]|nr:restriction endonuclease subunit S [Bacteroidota bacterium]MDP4231732.1 restriction endonuclease subunit S [Bacteroidota bacterium]MDP4243468.1 restriction endonuclease subunit S [Bacteroidota bacterium]MDP4289367.1 restriction endonuclease subunit S [Bacteroidota bacterium]
MKANWQTKTLGEVCEIYQPKTISAKEMTADGKFPVFGANGIIGKYHAFNHEEPQLLVTCRGATCGSINVSLPRSWITGNAMVVRPRNGNLDLRFLEYLLRGPIDLSQAITGSAQPQITRTNLSPLEISFPESLPEQRRIVGILDEVFARAATAKLNAEKNLANAREVFESYLQRVFARAWMIAELVSLSDLATDITDGDHLPPPKAPTGIPFITISDINKESRIIDFGNTFKVARKYYENLKDNRRPKFGDVLYTVTGSYGIPVIVDTEMEFCFQRHIGLIRPKSSVSSKWLYYLILAPQLRKQADEGATGTAQKTVSLKVLRNLLVPKVPVSEQKRVVQQLDALSSETKQLESLYKSKLLALEELKKSVLRSAFRGEL